MRLPIYSRETTYFVDFNSRELRPTENSMRPIPFSELTEEERADMRALRAEFWGIFHIPELDD